MANWKSKAMGKVEQATPKKVIGICLNSPEAAAKCMLNQGVEDPRHLEAKQAIASGDLSKAEALATESAPDGHVWPQYVLAVTDAFNGHPMRAISRTILGLRRPATESIGRHYQELLRQVQERFTASVPAMLAKKPSPRLSVCMITKNEEANLARCLRSVQKLANEIVVVDTGSTDSTVQIAKSFGAKVGFFEWTNDFAAARNMALDLASEAWALSIDADERLAEESQRAVRVSMCDPSCQFVPLVRSPSGGQAFANTRLFPREGARWHGAMHEDVRFEGKDQLPVYLSAMILNHEGGDVEASQIASKVERNLRALDVMRQGEEPMPGLFEVYEALIKAPAAPTDDATLDQLWQAALIAAPWRSVLSRQLVRQLAAGYTQSERFDDALRVVDLAEQHGLDGLWSSYIRSRYAFMKGDLPQARRFAELGLSTADDEGPIERMRADLAAILDQTK